MRENLETYMLAGVGALEGVWNCYIRPEITAKRSWALIAGFVALHELTCPPGQLLSEGVDRALERHPALVTAAVGLTALHLINKLPPQLDPFNQLTKIRST